MVFYEGDSDFLKVTTLGVPPTLPRKSIDEEKYENFKKNLSALWMKNRPNLGSCVKEKNSMNPKGKAWIEEVPHLPPESSAPQKGRQHNPI